LLPSQGWLYDIDLKGRGDMDKVKIKFAYKAGFRRLWLVVSVIWIVGYGGLVIDFGSRRPDFEGLLTTFVPVVLFYLLGAATVWIVEGFAQPDR
jgi:bacteriorhodopsin